MPPPPASRRLQGVPYLPYLSPRELAQAQKEPEFENVELN
jgi:hypothetical protein